MRKIILSSIAALAALGFAAAAQAEGGCAWSGNTVAATSKPAVTADNAKSPLQTTIPAKKTLAQTAKATNTEKGS
jgi:hypothetical protein